MSITILSMGKDVKRFTEIMKQANLKVKLLHLMKEYPRDLCQNQLFYESSSDFKVTLLMVNEVLLCVDRCLQ